MIEYKGEKYKSDNIPLLMLMLREAIESCDDEDKQKYKRMLVNTLISNYRNTTDEALLSQANLVEKNRWF